MKETRPFKSVVFSSVFGWLLKKSFYIFFDLFGCLSACLLGLVWFGSLNCT